MQETTENKDLLQFLRALIAGNASQPAEPSPLPTAPPQATVTPPQPAPAAPTSEAPAPAATVLLEAGSDGHRLPQRTPPKTYTVEETQVTQLRRHADAVQLRKERRASELASRREGDGPGDLSDAEART